MTGAVHFATRVRADPRAAAGYLDMLRAGGSEDGYPLLVRYGVDHATPAPYTAFLADLDATLDAIEGATS